MTRGTGGAGGEGGIVGGLVLLVHHHHLQMRRHDQLQLDVLARKGAGPSHQACLGAG